MPLKCIAAAYAITVASRNERLLERLESIAERYDYYAARLKLSDVRRAVDYLERFIDVRWVAKLLRYSVKRAIRSGKQLIASGVISMNDVRRAVENCAKRFAEIQRGSGLLITVGKPSTALWELLAL
jgi:tyrosyl-tRNA synthetase